MNRPLIKITAREKNQKDIMYHRLSETELTESVEWMNRDEISQKVHIIIKNNSQNKWCGIVHTEVGIPRKDPRFFMPGFMYGRNRGESPLEVPRQYPRIRNEENCPASPFWMVRGDRVSHPISMIYDQGRIIGIQASPYLVNRKKDKIQWNPSIKVHTLCDKENNQIQDAADFYRYAGFTCHMNGIVEGDEKPYAMVGYTLGYENAPWLFVESFRRFPREELSEVNCIELLPNEEIKLELVVYDYQAENETGIYRAIQETYRDYHQAPRQIDGMNIQKAVSELASAVNEAAWLKEDLCYSGFVRECADREGYEYNKLGSLAWTNGLSVATPMLMSSIRLSDEDMHSNAVSCIDNIVKKSINPTSGLPYDGVEDGKWSLKSWWFDLLVNPGHSAYLVGQAVYYVLKAYLYEKEYRKIEHKDWLLYAGKIVAKIEETKNGDYEYPLILSERTGAGIEYNSFGGCWLLAASALYSYVTKDTQYLTGMKLSEKHYYEVFVRHAECYGAPHDTNKAVDSEGILAYLRAVHYLHALTKEDEYLSHMGAALNYEFTFKFCYNSPVQIPPLSHVGWSSCGGSITSTANPHIHPMSSTVVDEMLYYIEKTGDSYVTERCKDTIGWGLQTFNTYDKEYDYGKTGWMSERFCYSQGLVVETYPDGRYASTWFTLMPWASASILEGLTGEAWKI